MESEQDDGVFCEDKVERKTEAEELQFLGVLAEGDGVLLDDV